ncbi:MAG: (E)-4-hydroxy-3-methylbut-2-enyl-diphosphate synthase [Bacteroidetes bacterium]|nr:(E)-4-hydroxy-3-methylbut-2-enyl-diphosphate synthase [Bacteroidota bacterium]
MEKTVSFDTKTLYRFRTRVVAVGDVPLGGDNPIRIQSMTTTDTMDAKGTVEQAIRIIKAGADYVRITAPSIKEAENLAIIRKELHARGFTAPLIADIHFTPNAAEAAARIVEKVRINPGNFADKKKFAQREYSDSEYAAELDRIREKFLPLVKICKEYGTAMRIGTNHGSLSDRIMNRYGDTPAGMVESAMEFVRICENEGYDSIVLSMKASNPIVMVQAYRLLVDEMIKTNRNYPVHLGVTEAGEGLDARVKSAAGIGTLLEEGIGDTIRISLAEEPEAEIPAAIALAKRYENRRNAIFPACKEGRNNSGSQDNGKVTISGGGERCKEKRVSGQVKNIGGKNVPVVVADFSRIGKITEKSLFSAGHVWSVNDRKWKAAEAACDYIYLGKNKIDFPPPSGAGFMIDAPSWIKEFDKQNVFPLFSAGDFMWAGQISDKMNFISVSVDDMNEDFIRKIKLVPSAILVFVSKSEFPLTAMRTMFALLTENKCCAPVILKRNYPEITVDVFCLHASTDAGGLLLDGLSDGVWLTGNYPLQDITALSFSILQATRTRISRTDYIACPSCGRTLFNLQETTQIIKLRTSHLKGVKIAVMGCIVNGPGEMADADYGYVGTGPGKITLYKGKEIVERNINEDDALPALIELIKKHGDWKEPQE